MPCARASKPEKRSRDRKSTRLNSSHDQISYAVFCLKKKKKKQAAPPCRRSAETARERGHAQQGPAPRDVHRACPPDAPTLRPTRQQVTAHVPWLQE